MDGIRFVSLPVRNLHSAGNWGKFGTADGAGRGSELEVARIGCGKDWMWLENQSL